MNAPVGQKEEKEAERPVATNRKARHEYAVLDTIEAGVVLTGTEVKSLRQGNANLAEGYARIAGGEAWLEGVHVSPYKQGSDANVDPLRKRKLLLHRREIRKLQAWLTETGITLIPLKLYFRKNVAKIQLGVCKGKRAYDKRQAIAKRESDRALRRMIRR
jgi:SsrA-binding protein